MQNSVYPFCTLCEKELEKKFETSCGKGLSQAEADKRLKLYGKNELENKKVYWWAILLRQLKSPFIYLLAAAGVLAFILGEAMDSAMIFLFIFINSFLGFYQEYKSEQALKTLQKFTIGMARVVRDGHQKLVKTNELVVGDILVLQTGDLMPADARIIGDQEVMIDETILTGESIAVYKNGKNLDKVPCDVYGAQNIIFSGTTIVNGSLKAVVVATGKQTTFGQIKKITSEISKESIFAKGISSFSSFIL